MHQKKYTFREAANTSGIERATIASHKLTNGSSQSHQAIQSLNRIISSSLALTHLVSYHSISTTNQKIKIKRRWKCDVWSWGFLVVPMQNAKRYYTTSRKVNIRWRWWCLQNITKFYCKWEMFTSIFTNLTDGVLWWSWKQYARKINI